MKCLAVAVLVILHSNLLLAMSTAGHILYKYKPFMMPESCRDGRPYCFDKGKNYPEDTISKLVMNMTSLIKSIEPVDDDFTVSIIDTRNGFEKPDCPFRSTRKPIYYIIDEFDSVRVVIQKPGKFEQIYDVTWCLKEGLITEDTTHFMKATTLQEFDLECVNTRMNYDFFVLDKNGNLKMELVQAKGGIPVCCRCRIKNE